MAIELPSDARVKPEDVRAICDTVDSISLDAFITQANALTNYVVSQDVNGLLTDALAIEIERLLAAHFYSLKDQLYRNKKTGEASATFQGQDGKRLETTHFGQNAIALDVTGTLADLNDGVTVVAPIWGGTLRSNARTFTDRNGYT